MSDSGGILSMYTISRSDEHGQDLPGSLLGTLGKSNRRLDPSVVTIER